MRKADVFLHEKKAGELLELEKGNLYVFEYDMDYEGPPVSVTMPKSQNKYIFDQFPPFFEGLLPEGANLDTLLRIEKIDKNDLFEILMTVGRDTVGAVTVIEANNEEMSDNI